MEFHSITLQDEANITKASSIATRIVRDHYDSILGKEQNDYMIEKFQSPEGIKTQIAQGSRYYLVEEKSKTIGFLSFYESEHKMYISKFYLDQSSRGKGYAAKMLNFIVKTAKDMGLQAVFLNVNKYNDNTIKIYTHLGFYKIREEKIDIGNGYFMDDYVLQLDIAQ